MTDKTLHQESKIKVIRNEEIVNCLWCECLVRLDRLEEHTDRNHKGANVWFD